MGEPLRILGMKFALEKLEGWATVRWKFRYPSFNRFWLIHPCDRQTDRNRRAIAYTHYSIYDVARKNYYLSGINSDFDEILNQTVTVITKRPTVQKFNFWIQNDGPTSYWKISFCNIAYPEADSPIWVKFCTNTWNPTGITVNKYVLNIDNSRWRTAAMLKIFMSPYFSQKWCDFVTFW